MKGKLNTLYICSFLLGFNILYLEYLCGVNEMAIIGIDLGTTNSVCAVFEGSDSVLIPNRFEEFMTPSVVSIDHKGEIIVGKIAAERLISHPDKSINIFKRFMGSDHIVKLGKHKFTAPELSALVLKSLKEDAEAYLGEEVSEAIISVPAYFNDIQRRATKLAGELAGLKVERLINEPTAAAMSYGLHERPDDTTFMILDMGGGTFDVSIMEYFEGVLEVHASAGDNALGGEDFLEVLVNDFLEKTEIDRKLLKASEMQHLYMELENIKKIISREKKIILKPIFEQQKEPWSIAREYFETICSSLLHRIQLPIEKALRDAKLSPAEIDKIILVGGATRMPIFRSLISRMFRQIPSFHLDPDLVIAMGTAIQAGLKSKNSMLDDVVLTDVSPYSLGIEVHNENDDGTVGGYFSPIIERNSVIPISIIENFTTTSDNQKSINVRIFQGESRYVNKNIFLSGIDFSIPKSPKGQQNIGVRFSYDMNGILDVDIKVDATGKVHNKTIINTTQSMSEKDIKQSLAKLAKLKFHPREDEENRHVMARLERIYETSLGDDRLAIAEMMTDFEVILEKQNLQDICRIRSRITEILDTIDSRIF